MATIEEAQAQVDLARQQIASQRQSANQATAQLTSQQSLRSAKGIQDVQNRQQNLSQIESYQSQVSQNESDVNTYQEEVDKAKAAEAKYNADVADYNAEVQAQQNAERYWMDKIPYGYLKGSREYKYLKALYDQNGSIDTYTRNQNAARNRLAEYKAGMYNNLSDEQLANVMSNIKKYNLALPEVVADTLNKQVNTYNSKLALGNGIMSPTPVDINKVFQPKGEDKFTQIINANRPAIKPVEPTGNVITTGRQNVYPSEYNQPNFDIKKVIVPGYLVNKALDATKPYYNRLFRQDQPEDTPVTIFDIPTAVVSSIPKAAGIAGEALQTDVEYFLPNYKGVTSTMPEKSINQRSTLIDFQQPTQRTQFNINSSTSKVLTTEQFVGGFKLGSELVGYAAIPESLLGLGFVTQGTQEAFNPKGTIQSRTLGAVEALGGAYILRKLPLEGATFRTVRPGETIREEVTDELGNVFIKTRKQTKPINVPVDVIAPIEQNGEQLNIGRFGIVRYTPQQYVNENPTGIKSLFFSGKQLPVSKPRIDNAVSSAIIVNQAGEIVNTPFIRTQRSGAKMYTYYTINGKQVVVSQDELAKIPEPFRTQFKNTFPVTSQEETLSVGEVTQKKFATISPSSKSVLFPNKGKATTVGSIVSKAKPIYADETVTVYETNLGFRDVSLPKKMTPSEIMKGKSYVLNKATVTTDEIGQSSTQILTPNPKAVERIRQIQVTTAKAIPKPTVNVPKAVRLSTNPEIKPSEIITVSSIPTVATSEFYGKGQYEQTQSSGGLLTISQQQAIQTIDIKADVKSDVKLQTFENVKVLQDTQVKVETKSSLKDYIGVREDTALKDRLALKELQSMSQAQDTLQAQSLKQAQATRQLQVQKQDTKQGIKIVPKTKLFGGIGLFGSSQNKKLSISEKVRQAYNVVVFRRGKEEIIGKNLPKGKATELGVKNVLSTLRASFKLKPTGTTTQEDIYYKVPSTFRPSKYDSERFVQLKNTRFGARTETKEAQIFRKQKKGKIKWF